MPASRPTCPGASRTQPVSSIAAAHREIRQNREHGLGGSLNGGDRADGVVRHRCGPPDRLIATHGGGKPCAVKVWAAGRTKTHRSTVNQPCTAMDPIEMSQSRISNWGAAGTERLTHAAARALVPPQRRSRRVTVAGLRWSTAAGRAAIYALMPRRARYLLRSRRARDQRRNRAGQRHGARRPLRSCSRSSRAA